MKVFVSYARRSPQWKQELCTTLNQLQAAGQITAWVEAEQLEPGAEWEEKIQTALRDADAAILVITRHFAASDFIRKQEVPALLARLKDKKRLIPIFCEKTNLDTAPYPYRDRHGNRSMLALTLLQGIAAPNKPMNSLTDAEQHDEWYKLGQHLTKMAGEVSRKPDRTQARTMFTPSVVTLPELTIELTHKDGILSRTYHAHKQTISGPQTDWARVIELCATERVTSPEKVPETHLFSILFGEGDEVGNTFGQLNQGERERRTPAFQAYRTGIRCNDALLRSLPWAATDWRGQLRRQGNGWSFVTTGDEERIPASLTTPFQTVLLSQDRASWQHNTALTALPDTLRAALGIAPTEEDRRVQTVSMSDDDWRRCVLDRENTMIIVHDTSSDHRITMELVDAAASVQHRFAMLGVITDHPISQIPESLRNAGEFVSIEHLGPAPCQHANWAHHFLTRDTDPIDAWNRILWSSAGSGEALARVRLHANVRQWNRFSVAHSAIETHLANIFDRYTLKGLLNAELLELTRIGASTRVLVVMPFGTASDHVSDFDQILHYNVRDKHPQVPISKLREIGLPEPGEHFYKRIGQHFAIALDGYDGREPLKEHLRRTIEPAAWQAAIKARRKPIIWLNWGAFGPENGQFRELEYEELREWLEYCNGHLVNHCPSDALVICTLSQQTQNWEKLESVLRDIHRQPGLNNPNFLLMDPMRLEKIDEGHIYKLFVRYPALFTGGEQLMKDVVDAVVRIGEGRFSDSVRLLERGYEIGWESLLRELRGKRPTSTDRHDLV